MQLTPRYDDPSFLQLDLPPLPCPVPGEHRWLVNGLAEVFDLQP